MLVSYKLVHGFTMGSLIAMGNNFQAKMQQWLEWYSIQIMVFNSIIASSYKITIIQNLIFHTK